MQAWNNPAFIYPTTLSAFFFLMLTLTSCAHKPFEAEQPEYADHSGHSARHALYIDRRGYAITETLWAANLFDTNTWYGADRSTAEEDKLVSAIGAQARQELAACTDNLTDDAPTNSHRDKPKKEILIFIHGGLNTNTTSLRRTKDLLFKKSLTNKCRFPIFINWRSGPFSSYKDHLISIRQGTDGGLLAKATSPLYFVTDIAQAAIGAPKSWLVQSKHSIRSTVMQDFSDYDALQDCAADQGRKLACKPSFELDCKTGKNRRGWRTALWWTTSPAKTVITPLTFELGKAAWNVMLHRTNSLLWKSCSLQTGCVERQDVPDSYGLGQGALSKLIRSIEAITRDDDAYEITLVGHSMGAIVINRIVAAMPQLPVQNIVFLAAADSIRNTQYGALRYLKDNQQARFYSWMLHPDNEARELPGWGFAPSGSLLAWIDTMFTTPESLLDYRFGRWDSIKQFPELFSDEIATRSRLMVFPRDKQSAPHAHGDFNECQFWKLDDVELNFEGEQNIVAAQER